MPAFRVRLTRRAQAYVERACDWWRENRTAAPDLLEMELAGAYRRLATDAQLYSVFTTFHGKAVHRLLLPETRYHLYYVIDESEGVVLLLALWHASRGRRPPLRMP